MTGQRITLLVTLLAVVASPAALAQTAGVARGTFTVRMAPLPAYDDEDGTMLGRMSLDKEWHGELAGTSRGEMLTAITGVAGSAAYVAVERVSGTLHGRRGTFVLQHTGVMARGTPQLSITVVPDSGTEELRGLSGTLTLDLRDGVHAYEFVFEITGEAGDEAGGHR